MTLSDPRIAEIRAQLAAAGHKSLISVTRVEADPSNVCIKHEHWDLWRQEADMRDVDSRPGTFTASLEFNQVNVGCYLGEEADARLFASAPSSIEYLLGELDALRAQLEEATKENQQLLRFAGIALGDCRGDAIGDWDGGAIQDSLVICGLLNPVEVDDACGEACRCADDGDFPTTCYRFTGLARRAMDVARSTPVKASVADGET